MQFTSLFTVLATAAIASAAAMPVARPEPITMPHDTPVGAACGQSEEKVACCNGGGSGGNSRFAGFSPFGGACSLNAREYYHDTNQHCLVPLLTASQSETRALKAHWHAAQLNRIM